MAAALLVGAACGSNDTTAAPGSTGTTDVAVAVDGRTFVGADVSVGGEPTALVAGTQISVRFDEGQLGADAGCNSMGGSYRFDGDALVVDALATTEMGCDDARSEQDAWIADFLSSGPTITLDGARLAMTVGDTTVVLTDREVADPDRPLTGTTWVLDSLITGDAVSNVALDEVPTLEIASDGSLTLFAGCNTARGEAEIDGDVLRVGALDVADGDCTAPAADVEAAVLAVLEQPTTWSIDAGRLVLDAGGAGLGWRAG